MDRFFLCAITRARNSLRALAYSSSDIRLSGVINPTTRISLSESCKSIGHSNQRQRMLFVARRAAAVAYALFDVPAGDRAVRADEIRSRLRHLAEYGPPDFHRF